MSSSVQTATVQPIFVHKTLSLTKKEIEGKVASVDATQIEAIAKIVIAQMMGRLNIDVFRGPVRGMVNRDITGQEHPVFKEQFDPDSAMFRNLLPAIIDLVTEAFSNPGQFVENGFTVVMTNPVKTGMCDRIEDELLRHRVAKGIRRIIDGWDLNTLEFVFCLKVKEKCVDELRFDLNEYANGAFVGNMEYTLKSFAEAVVCSTTH